MKLFVSIDSSKKTNQCCIVDDSGRRLKEICVTNNLSGANKLEYIIAEQARNLGVKSIKVGTEATDFYDFHILEFLASSETLEEYQTIFYRFNPRVIKAFKTIVIPEKTFQFEKAEDPSPKLSLG